MGERIQLIYTVPVYVTVDLDTREVDRVVVDDEDRTFTSKALTDEGEPFTDVTHIRRCHVLAEHGNIMWPAWEFGW